MTSMFANLLTWIVGFAFYVPFQIIRLIGLLFPSCASLGLLEFSDAILVNAVNWIRFYWPILQYVPWGFIWNFLSAVFLYVFVRWLMGHFGKIATFVVNFWWIIAVFYVAGAVVDFFVSDSWRNSTVFTAVFGTSPTSTGFSGGGGGGGGGSSW